MCRYSGNMKCNVCRVTVSDGSVSKGVNKTSCDGDLTGFDSPLKVKLAAGYKRNKQKTGSISLISFKILAPTLYCTSQIV